MRQVLGSRSGVGIFRPIRDPVKLTALIYLREALLKERYEDCADIISVAREFGASADEIRWFLENPRRFPRV